MICSCNFESDELVWDRDYHEMTGKWRLFHQGQGRPHECQVHKLEEPERKLLKDLSQKAN